MRRLAKKADRTFLIDQDNRFILRDFDHPYLYVEFFVTSSWKEKNFVGTLSVKVGEVDKDWKAFVFKEKLGVHFKTKEELLATLKEEFRIATQNPDIYERINKEYGQIN